jgi:hypothetical protein
VVSLRPGQVPDIQVRPDLLPGGEHWTYTCHCGTTTQGGVEGLAAHQATVHSKLRDSVNRHPSRKRSE